MRGSFETVFRRAVKPAARADRDIRDIPSAPALVGQDNQEMDDQRRFILAQKIGEAFITSDVPADAVQRLLKD